MSPMKLGDLQRAFLDLVFADGRGEASLRERMAGELLQAHRLCAYVDGYPARIRDALLDTCEACLALLGEEDFDAIAWDFSQNYRSRFWDLGAVARDFVPFLREHPSRESFPWLAELAALECLVMESFHAEAGAALTVPLLQEGLAARAENFAMTLQPFVRLAAFETAAASRWLKAQDMDEGAEISERAEVALVTRNEWRVRVRALAAKEACFYRLLSEGAPLREICAKFEDEVCHEGEEPPLQDWIARAVAEGLLLA